MKPKRNHRGHGESPIDKKNHKVFQSAQSISLCSRLEAPTVGCGQVVSVFSVVNFLRRR